ncbi:hypothetical protein FB451DRAFT_1417671 [Mycena latifolia]|nr:hypothetical protein FB451DRAFT_1417671 [Mycena latifolia]
MPTDLIIPLRPRPFHHTVLLASATPFFPSSSSPRVRLGRLTVIATTTDLIIPLFLPPLHRPPSFFPVIRVFPNADDACRSPKRMARVERLARAPPRRMDLGVGVHPSPSSLSASGGTGALTDLEWGAWVSGAGSETVENARAERLAKRETLSWNDFSTTRFSRSGAPLTPRQHRRPSILVYLAASHMAAASTSDCASILAARSVGCPRAMSLGRAVDASSVLVASLAAAVSLLRAWPPICGASRSRRGHAQYRVPALSSSTASSALCRRRGSLRTRRRLRAVASLARVAIARCLVAFGSPPPPADAAARQAAPDAATCWSLGNRYLFLRPLTNTVVSQLASSSAPGAGRPIQLEASGARLRAPQPTPKSLVSPP